MQDNDATIHRKSKETVRRKAQGRMCKSHSEDETKYSSKVGDEKELGGRGGEEGNGDGNHVLGSGKG